MVMMWRCSLVGAAVAMAACYAPTVADGVPCGEGSACPTGQTCDVDQRCRSRMSDAGPADGVDASPSNDVDNDGITDDADNCAMTANADQRDHDADLHGDVCDNCPHVANEAQAVAMDADLVGDACDPDQGRIDTLDRFDGFYELPNGWTLPPGWTVTNGRLTATVATGFQFAYLNASVGANVTVVTAATMVPANATGNVSVIAHLTPMAAQYYRCAVIGGTTGRAQLAIVAGQNLIPLDEINFLSASYTDIALRIDLTGANITCLARAGLETANLGATSSLAGGSRTGLRIREATGSFDYFVVFTH